MKDLPPPDRAGKVMLRVVVKAVIRAATSASVSPAVLRAVMKDKARNATAHPRPETTGRALVRRRSAITLPALRAARVTVHRELPAVAPVRLGVAAIPAEAEGIAGKSIFPRTSINFFP